MRRKKFIQVPKGTVPKLCEELKCKKTAVYDALNYNTESKLANIIRKKAVTIFGGVETTKLVLTPCC